MNDLCRGVKLGGGSRTKCRVGSWVTGMVPSKLLADRNEGLELPEYIYIQLLQHCAIKPCTASMCTRLGSGSGGLVVPAAKPAWLR